jgi:hypothetical protein
MTLLFLGTSRPGLWYNGGGVELITDVNIIQKYRLLSQGPLFGAASVTDSGPHSEANRVPVLTMEPEQIMILIFVNMLLRRKIKNKSRKLCVHPIYIYNK